VTLPRRPRRSPEAAGIVGASGKEKPSLRPIVVTATAALTLACASPRTDPTLTEYTHARWWDGERLIEETKLVRDGVFVPRSEEAVPGDAVDLEGGFATAPFGEGHNHDLMESLFEAANRAYLEQGVFYVKVPTSYPPAIDSVRSRLARTDTVDAIFSMGGLTSPGGHPVSLFVDRLAGSVYDAGLGYEDFAGQAFHEIRGVEDIEPALSSITAQGGDFVKIFLLYSEDYDRSAEAGWGIDPDFVAPAVTAAHARGVTVTAHVQSAHDFRVAVGAGVDEVAHLPGYAWPPDRDGYDHRITDADAEAAADAGVAVVTTTATARRIGTDEDRLATTEETQRANLAALAAAGVELRIGSDLYDRTGRGEQRYGTRAEVLHLVEIGAMDAEAALARWIATGRAIFPDRQLGCFEPGCEASFLVFDGDPRLDISRIAEIRRRVKEGIEISLE